MPSSSEGASAGAPAQWNSPRRWEATAPGGEGRARASSARGGTGGSMSATTGEERRAAAAEAAATPSSEGLPLGAAGEEASGAGGSGATPGSLRQQQHQQQQGGAHPDIPPIKDRVRWTPALHQLFVEAVDRLGGALKAKPKEIMAEMKVPQLSLNHIKSHLQKHRAVEAALKRQAEHQQMREQQQQQQQQQQLGGLGLPGFQGPPRPYGSTLDLRGGHLPYKRPREEQGLPGTPVMGHGHAGQGHGGALIEHALQPMQVYQANPTRVVVSGGSLPVSQPPQPTWHSSSGVGLSSYPNRQASPFAATYSLHRQHAAEQPQRDGPALQLLQHLQAEAAGQGRRPSGAELDAVQVVRQLIQRRQELLQQHGDAPLLPPSAATAAAAAAQGPLTAGLPQLLQLLQGQAGGAGHLRAPSPSFPPLLGTYGQPAPPPPPGAAVLEQLAHMVTAQQRAQQAQQEAAPPFSLGDRELFMAAVHLLSGMQEGQQGQHQQLHQQPLHRPLVDPAPMALDQPIAQPPVARNHAQPHPPLANPPQQQQGQGSLLPEGSNSRPSGEETTWQPGESGGQRQAGALTDQQAPLQQQEQQQWEQEAPPAQQQQQQQQQQPGEAGQAPGEQEGVSPLHRTGGRAASSGWDQDEQHRPSQGHRSVGRPTEVQQHRQQEEQLAALLKAAAAARQAQQAPAPVPRPIPLEVSVSSAGEDPDAAMAAAAAALLASAGGGGEGGNAEAMAAAIVARINGLLQGATLAEKLVQWHLAVAEAVRDDVWARKELHAKAEGQLRVSSESLLQVAQSLGSALLPPPPQPSAAAGGPPPLQPGMASMGGQPPVARAHAHPGGGGIEGGGLGALRERLAALQALGLLLPQQLGSGQQEPPGPHPGAHGMG